MSNTRTAVVALIVCGTLGAATMSFAELPPPTVMAQMKAGKITAIGKEDVQIDGTTLRVREGVVIVDHEGQPLPVEEIRRNGLVTYLLKAGQIEIMIVTNPQ